MMTNEQVGALIAIIDLLEIELKHARCPEGVKAAIDTLKGLLWDDTTTAIQQERESYPENRLH